LTSADRAYEYGANPFGEGMPLTCNSSRSTACVIEATSPLKTSCGVAAEADAGVTFAD
jgi:hypothetical protein